MIPFTFDTSIPYWSTASETSRGTAAVGTSRATHSGRCQRPVVIGICLRMLGKYQDAVECFQRATQCEPRKVELHEELGHWLGRLGRKDEAVTAYTHAIGLNPRRYQAHTALAVHRIQCVAVLEREIRPISAHRTRLRSNHREDEPAR
jgi:Flp pilus assembly protein TadD